MPANKDPYDILGVSRTATQDEIKRAYRRLAKEHHPDRNQGDKQAEQRFKEVQAAYEVLGDAERRKQFDRFGAGGPAPEFHSWGAGQGGARPFGGGVDFGFSSMGDLSSIIEQFFRGGGGRVRRGGRGAPHQPAPRGGNLEHTVDLSFEEAAHGAERTVVLTTPAGGDEHIRFQVPPGVRDAQRIRVRGQGHEGPGGRGDLIVTCRIRPHPYFRRDGYDVLLDLPVTFVEATLGAQVEIPTLEGTTIVKIPPGTSGGTKLRLRSRGIRDPRVGTTGDMYALVRIIAPQEVSDRARELLEALADELKQHPRAAAGWPD
jgi:DnaJ-class molecular chaperone